MSRQLTRTARIRRLMAGIAGRIPGASYQELPGTPHMQTLERPELVAAALNDFLPAGALDTVET